MTTDVKTALAIVIPPELTDQINQIRSQYDRAFPRWMPHFNFLFPFVPPNSFPNSSQQLKQELKEFGDFELTLDHFDYFKQKRHVTYHLTTKSPQEREKLQQLFDKIRNILPNVPVKSLEFHPHLTLAQSKKSEIDEMMELLQKSIKPIKIRVSELFILERTESTPFGIKHLIPLSTS